RRIYDLIEL
nr:Chain C, EPSTEIN-BARR NUCLEAR ANTIGEN-6 [human gammaherpesvirus 4]